MGRYTSVQTFTDQKTKVVDGYKAGGAPEPARPEKVVNVSGSSGGAGSCDFHLYRAARTREKTRIEQLESTQVEEQDRAAFRARIEENRKEAETRTKKNAEKRKKRKQKKGLAKELAKSDGSAVAVSGNDDSGDDDGGDDGDGDEERQRPLKKGRVDKTSLLSEHTTDI